jgi:hypothetical protein
VAESLDVDEGEVGGAFNLEEPTQMELALVMIGEERGIKVPDRPCERCDEEIPADRRGPGVKFCSDRCRKATGNHVIAV